MSELLVPCIGDRIKFLEELEKLKKGLSAPLCLEQEHEEVHDQEIPEHTSAIPGTSTPCVSKLTWCDLEGYK